ncbi:PilN domain-containing protein [Shewanella maritima]|uniref:PilN domain-containing protein n=1 Tax=Shewanella maritima TaxID=2520507 RepID=UPI0037350E6E
MKTRINLYSANLLPPKLRLSLKRLVMFTVAVVAICAICLSLMLWQQSSYEQQRTQVAAEKESLDMKKAQLEAQIAARKPNADLVAKVELEQKRLEIKRLLKVELSARKDMISRGYSPLLVDLAQAADDSVWLSQIYVAKGQYSFAGFGSSAQSIPLWIERLKTTQTLQGYSFASMTMNRGDDQPLAFTLTSQVELVEAGK